jgi:hypothetical protein
MDHIGIAKLSSALTRVEYRLQNSIDQYFKDNLSNSTNVDVKK